MTKIALFAGGDLTYFEYDFDYFVGIDRGSLFLLKMGFLWTWQWVILIL